MSQSQIDELKQVLLGTQSNQGQVQKDSEAKIKQIRDRDIVSPLPTLTPDLDLLHLDADDDRQQA